MKTIRSYTKTISFVLITTLLISCKPVGLYFEEPEGPDEFVQGWRDGCETGISAEGDIFQKMIYNYTKDPALISNSLYRQGWNEAQLYCRRYVDNRNKAVKSFWGSGSGEH